MGGNKGNKLPQIKSKPATVQLLDKQLNSYDLEIRKTGWVSIPKLGAPLEPLSECIAAALDHENWFIKDAGVEACVNAIYSKGAEEEAVKKLAGPRMSAKDSEVRRCAGRSLVRIAALAGDPNASRGMPEMLVEDAATEIASRMSHEDPVIRTNAVLHLLQLGELARSHVPQMIKLLRDPDHSVVRAVLKACADLGPVATDGVGEVAHQLLDEDEGLRRIANNAMMILAKHSGAKVASTVVKMLRLAQTTAQRRYILLRLIELGPLVAPHGKALIGLLEDPDASIRATVTRTLLSCGPTVAENTVALVQQRLEHEDPDVRRGAADAMRAMAPRCPIYAQSVGKLLLEEPEEKTEESIRYKVSILRILGGAEKNAGPFLQDLADSLGDKDWGVRRAAIEALGDLGEDAKSAAADVARRLLNADPEARKAAAEAMGVMGKNVGRYANSVEAMLDTEEDEDVRDVCAQAYERLKAAGAMMQGGTSPTSPAQGGTEPTSPA